MHRIAFAFLLFVPICSVAQGTQSSTIATKEASVLCPQVVISGAVLTGTASWTMGSDKQTGQVVLKARANGQSRADLALGSGPRSEIRINSQQNPQYETLAGGQWTTRAFHNSWVDANWFFPALSALVVGPQNGYSLVYASDSFHVYSQFQVANQKPSVTTQVQTLSTVLYDLDSTTQLPTALHFYTHPESDFGVNIPVDVRFSNYQVVSGVQVPFRIQRFLNGTLQLDITISSVAINPNPALTDSDFAAN